MELRMVTNFGLLKTHGEAVGEKMDISEFLKVLELVELIHM
jgi:hypothetical protein